MMYLKFISCSKSVIIILIFDFYHKHLLPMTRLISKTRSISNRSPDYTFRPEKIMVQKNDSFFIYFIPAHANVHYEELYKASGVLVIRVIDLPQIK